MELISRLVVIEGTRGRKRVADSLLEAGSPWGDEGRRDGCFVLVMWPDTLSSADGCAVQAFAQLGGADELWGYDAE